VLDLARRASRCGYTLDAQGCDISDTAVQHATDCARHLRVPVGFFKADVLSDPLPRRYTVITCSLFLHHLEDAQIQALLRKLAAHTDHLIVSDLIRGRVGYALAWCGTLLLSTSHVVHEDGLRSVRAALTLPEARVLADAAGLRGARFRRCWPQRFLMTWSAGPGRDAG
jgi:2-polyprenyl-3-methyl-5-hydroxy-6-metoxy-1,4-benzoquinol methylase